MRRSWAVIWLAGFLMQGALPGLSGEIHEAAGAGDLAKIEDLLRTDAALVREAGPNGATPLHFAARAGRVEAMKALLKSGAELNTLNNDLHPPLYCALHNGKVESVRFLLEQGATFTTPDKYGALAIHQAVRGGSPELVEALLEKGAAIDAANQTNGMTALHLAAGDGKTEVLAFLLRKGADMNRTTSDGSTALHLAAGHGHLACVQALLEKGGNPNSRNKLGFKPLDLVKGKENDQLAAFLQERTASDWQETGSGSVGEAGDTDLLEFQGNAAFEAASIRGALAGSVSYLLAAHPQAERRQFLEVLRQQVLSGYHNGGFPDAKVSCGYDEKSGRVSVTIEEGPRFLCGEVLVQGAKGALRSTIINRLTKWQRRMPQLKFFQGQSPGSDPDSKQIEEGLRLKAEVRLDPKPPGGTGGQQPPWCPGKPVNFAPGGGEAIETTVKTCLLEKGFLFPTVKSKVEPDPRTGQARLSIVIADRGPAGTIVDIDVKGNRRSTRAEILKLIGLRSGKTLDGELFRRVDQKLWDSGRFVSWRMEPQVPQNPDNPKSGVRLLLEVVENEDVPPLGQKLSHEAQTVMKCADWMRDFEKRSEDLVVSFSSLDPESPVSTARIIVSPHDGGLIEMTLAKSPVGNVSLLFGQRELGLFLPERNSKFQIEDPDLLTQLVIQLTPNAPGSSNQWNFTMGGGFQHIERLAEEGGATPPFQLHVNIPRSGVLGSVTKFPGTGVFRGRTLTIHDPENTNNLVTVDERTGRFELTSMKAGMAVTTRFETGAFRKARKSIEDTHVSAPNRYVAGHLFSSFASFVAGQLAFNYQLNFSNTNTTPAQRERGAVLLSQLLGPDLFAPLDKSDTWGRGPGDFSIPMDDLEMALAKNSIATMMAGFVFKYSNDLFPKYSWPWTVAREAVFVVAGQPKYTDAELQRLYGSQETGPIGSLVIAKLLSNMNPQGAKTFALRGIMRLSAEDFLNDCNLLLKGNSGLARSFRNVAEKLRTMPEEDVETLVALLGPEEGRLVAQSAKALRDQPEKPLAFSLAPALERYWTDKLRSRVRADLQQLTTGKPDRTPSSL